MIKLIPGRRGSGKTKILIEQINESVKSTNGNIVCIEKGDNIRRSISYKARWCDVEQFGVEGIDAFYGFVAGMLAGNYDIKDIFVDGIFKIVGRDYEAFGAMLEKLDKLTGEDSVVTFTVSVDVEELSENVKQFIK